MNFFHQNTWSNMQHSVLYPLIWGMEQWYWAFVVFHYQDKRNYQKNSAVKKMILYGVWLLCFQFDVWRLITCFLDQFLDMTILTCWKQQKMRKKWNVELHPSNAFFASLSYWHVPLGNLRTVWADMDKNNTSMVLYVNFDITILWSLWMTHYLGLQFNRTWFGQCNLHYDMQNST